LNPLDIVGFDRKRKFLMSDYFMLRGTDMRHIFIGNFEEAPDKNRREPEDEEAP